MLLRVAKSGLVASQAMPIARPTSSFAVALPLHMTALIHGGIPAARFLLANGADANARNNDGERPRDLADDRDLDELERVLK